VRVGPVASTDAIGYEMTRATGIAGVTTIDGVDVRTLRPRTNVDVSVSPLTWGPNMAPLGAATASSTYDLEPGYDPSKGIDGYLDTRWSSMGISSTFDVEWTTPQKFNTIVLNNYIPNSPLAIQVWDDATGQYETVACTDQTSGIVKLRFADKTSTKLRLNGVISFYELGVYYTEMNMP
jgi:hypothetical protein